MLLPQWWSHFFWSPSRSGHFFTVGVVKGLGEYCISGLGKGNFHLVCFWSEHIDIPVVIDLPVSVQLDLLQMFDAYE